MPWHARQHCQCRHLARATRTTGIACNLAAQSFYGGASKHIGCSYDVEEHKSPQDACSDAGKPGEAVHASFSSYVSREMGKAEALHKVVGSRPENLVDNFFTLMPSGSPADFQRILELKVG